MVASAKQPARPSILGLFTRRCPSAIVGRIAALVVNAIDRQSLRLLSHVRKKVFEFVPPLANGNAATSIGFVTLVGLGIASLVHPSPYQKRAADSASNGMPMYQFAPPSVLDLKTATRLRIAASQISYFGGEFGTTVAADSPANNPRLIGRAIENSQATIAMSCDIKEVGHCNLSGRLQAKWRLDSEQVQPLRFCLT